MTTKQYKPLREWKAEMVAIMGLNNRVGWTVMDGDDSVADFLFGNGWSTAACRRNAHLVAAAPRMKNDIDSFIAAMEEPGLGRSEHADIARDLYVLFKETQKLAEGKK